MNNQVTAKVGVGRRVISPPLGTELVGYELIRKTESIHDDLTVAAAAFEYDGKRSLLISATILLLLEEDSVAIRKAVSEATGVPFEHIILACTHTHSSPATYTEIKNYAYINDILTPGTVQAAVEAVDSLQPAVMGIGTTESYAGSNRRQVLPDGSITLGQNPWGCFDSTMTVISFRSTEGKPIVNLIHYGAHCTGAGRSVEVTRDWPGLMIDRLEEQSGAITMFINGAIGDTGPRLSNGTTAFSMELMLETSAVAAVDAVRAYRTIKEYRPVDMKVFMKEIKLPYHPLMPYEEAKEQFAQYGGKIDYYGKAYHLKEIISVYESGEPIQDHMSINQTMLCIGSVAIVPFPFEMFTEMTLRLRAFSPYQHTLSMSNANGSYAYLPSQDQICRGGYEVGIFRNFNAYSLKDNTDTTLVVQLLDLLKQLDQQ